MRRITIAKIIILSSIIFNNTLKGQDKLVKQLTDCISKSENIKPCLSFFSDSTLKKKRIISLDTLLMMLKIELSKATNITIRKYKDVEGEKGILDVNSSGPKENMCVLSYYSDKKKLENIYFLIQANKIKSLSVIKQSNTIIGWE